eukprot:CAMPEP_0167759064 /NCGR_PEP_ID=MMETSP0110_2-20121227/10815_1 /TAXON_ID=629695 /ORGANISM="Gymnochlora sp., Strain CCMP2014" /LENGTH=113 /DNA_ID=CAMNT_0007645407 /DNA_START=530 /DNA_END=871 /DNA_ORIENTATION=+
MNIFLWATDCALGIISLDFLGGGAGGVEDDILERFISAPSELALTLGSDGASCCGEGGSHVGSENARFDGDDTGVSVRVVDCGGSTFLSFLSAASSEISAFLPKKSRSLKTID